MLVRAFGGRKAAVHLSDMLTGLLQKLTLTLALTLACRHDTRGSLCLKHDRLATSHLEIFIVSSLKLHVGLSDHFLPTGLERRVVSGLAGGCGQACGPTGSECHR